MDTAAAWSIFLNTGLPEAYTLFCFLREEERRGEEKTA